MAKEETADAQKPVDNVSEYASALDGDDEDFKDAMLFEEKDNPLEEEEPAAATILHPNMVDLDSMKDAVFFLFEDRNQRLSRFWILIVCASIIATMGLAGDSSATVIGAMIVGACLYMLVCANMCNSIKKLHGFAYWLIFESLTETLKTFAVNLQHPS